MYLDRVSLFITVIKICLKVPLQQQYLRLFLCNFLIWFSNTSSETKLSEKIEQNVQKELK